MTDLMTLNRSLVAVYFQPAFFELIKHKLETTDTLDDLNESPLLFLIPGSDEDTMESTLSEYEENIIAAALELFFDEDEETVPTLSLSFDQYFELEAYEDVYDLASDYELSYEEDDEDEDGDFDEDEDDEWSSSEEAGSEFSL